MLTFFSKFVFASSVAHGFEYFPLKIKATMEPIAKVIQPIGLDTNKNDRDINSPLTQLRFGQPAYILYPPAAMHKIISAKIPPVTIQRTIEPVLEICSGAT
jgi:hypothetical protein